MNTEQCKVLVVRVPALTPLDNIQEMRDFVLESLRAGVLLLGPGVTYSVEDFPALGPVVVEAAAADGQPPGPPTVGSEALHSDIAEEKREILRRLRLYRQEHEPGCLEDVAKATHSRGKITAMMLRDVLIGGAVLDIADWRRIGRGLERLGASAPAEEGWADG